MLDSRGIHALTETEYCTCWTVEGYMLSQRRNTVHAGQKGDTCSHRDGILYMLDSRGIHALTETEYCTCWTVGGYMLLQWRNTVHAGQ
jgi:hypothetical protein